MQFADPSAPLEWVYQVRYFCADSEQPRDAEPVKTKKKASVFDSELAFDIPIRRDCTPDTKNLTWYVDHASRANHKARVHLHTSLQLARELFYIAKSDNPNRKAAGALIDRLNEEHKVYQELRGKAELTEDSSAWYESVEFSVMDELNAAWKVAGRPNWTDIRIAAITFLHPGKEALRKLGEKKNAIDKATKCLGTIAKQLEGGKASYDPSKTQEQCGFTDKETFESLVKDNTEKTKRRQELMTELDEAYETFLNRSLPWTPIARGQLPIGRDLLVLTQSADNDDAAIVTPAIASNGDYVIVAITNTSEEWDLSGELVVREETPKDTEADITDIAFASVKLLQNIMKPLRSMESTPEDDFFYYPDLVWDEEPDMDMELIRLGRFQKDAEIEFELKSSDATHAGFKGNFNVRKARRIGLRGGFMLASPAAAATGIVRSGDSESGEILYNRGRPQLTYEEEAPENSLGLLLGLALYARPTLPGQHNVTSIDRLDPYLLLAAGLNEFQFSLESLENLIKEDVFLGVGLGGSANFGLTFGAIFGERPDAVINASHTGWSWDEDAYGYKGWFLSINGDLQITEAFLSRKDELKISMGTSK